MIPWFPVFIEKFPCEHMEDGDAVVFFIKLSILSFTSNVVCHSFGCQQKIQNFTVYTLGLNQ
jgi:hypothetical protein